VALEFELRASHWLDRHSYCLSHSARPFLRWVFSRWGFKNFYLLRLALNCDPPDLCLLSS
jgi:hypothetical protein